MTTSRKTPKKTVQPGSNAPKSVKKTSVTKERPVGDIALYHQKNIQALTDCSMQVTQSARKFNEETVNYTKRSLDETLAGTQDIIAAKSLPEFVERQIKHTRKNMQSTLAHYNKVNELLLQFAQQAYTPLISRMATVTTATRT